MFRIWIEGNLGRVAIRIDAGRSSGPRESWRESFSKWLGACILLVPPAVGATFILPNLLRPSSRTTTIGFDLVGIDATSYILAQPLVYLRYLKLAVLPTDLVLDYGWIPTDFSSWLWLGGTLWIAVIGLLVWLWKKHSLVALPLFWSLLVLATTSFVPTQDLIYDHRFYLPLGLIIATIMTGVGCWEGTSRLGKPILGAVVALAILLSFATFSRNLDYISTLRLAQVDAERQPSNPRALYRVAAFDDDSSKFELEHALRTAIEMSENRGYWYAGTNYSWRRELADLLYLTGRHLEARPWYLAAIKENHNRLQEAEIILSLAMIASMNGEATTANKLFEKGLGMNTEINDRLQQAYDIHLQRARETKEEGADVTATRR